MAGTAFAEDEIGRRWDRCFTDAIIKLGGGILLGGTFSLLLFKRRKWPILGSAGFGLGMAYANCQQDLNAALVNPKLRECKNEEGKK